MDVTNLSEALDLGSRALAVIVSAVGLIVAVSQWTRPALLARREKWLREAMASETNTARRDTLAGMLTDTTAQLVAGVHVPGWRFIVLVALMLFGPVQAFGMAKGDASVWGVVLAVFLSFVITANPMRMAIRMLAERYRVAHEYRTGQAINPPRVGILNLTEGGSRREFTFAYLIALAVNVLAASVSLFVAGQTLWGLVLGLTAVASGVVLAGLVNRYAASRVGIYGPWSVEDPKM
ncbi:hypothetical protein [Microbacterium sp. EST19A]|uniref:hypothetical protein n=1 Tax=Microbacterium sp. EST19A TaxID=2862681 RepID=UPI001CC1BFC9|nr:hypothetical protein [Microbacterium sp. EST19A]